MPSEESYRLAKIASGIRPYRSSNHLVQSERKEVQAYAQLDSLDSIVFGRIIASNALT